MAASEDVKRAAELKLWLEGRISELQEELERLRETLGYVDATLKAGTFRPAIEMLGEDREVAETRELKRDKGGQILATAAITSDSVTIEPKDGVVLKTGTPPFNSFLVGKILQGMKSKDEELVSAGKLKAGQELRFDVESTDGVVSKIIVENYGDKARLNEIVNTMAWTFSRMLEK
ncbi:MAG: hypothetical protein JRN24_00825 [Nitrososphaerota archaeon]|nr:hypothetical protein [Nitrososphaerota archaeon]